MAKRRADGTVRPAVRRYRQRKQRERRIAREAALTPEQRAEREVWLANFDPAHRKGFFRSVRIAEAIFLRGFATALGLSQEEASPLLRAHAVERNWLILETLDGLCVGAGPLHRVKKRKKLKDQP